MILEKRCLFETGHPLTTFVYLGHQGAQVLACICRSAFIQGSGTYSKKYSCSAKVCWSAHYLLGGKSHYSVLEA